jgi:hypothetical protein
MFGRDLVKMIDEEAYHRTSNLVVCSPLAALVASMVQVLTRSGPCVPMQMPGRSALGDIAIWAGKHLSMTGWAGGWSLGQPGGNMSGCSCGSKMSGVVEDG